MEPHDPVVVVRCVRESVLFLPFVCAFRPRIDGNSLSVVLSLVFVRGLLFAADLCIGVA